MPKGMVKVETRPSRELEPGDRLGSLEVVAAPGHTPGQIAFLDTRDRSLIAGDSFSSLGGLYTSSTFNPRFPFPTLATWDRATALATAKALRALDPSRLARRPRPGRRGAGRCDGHRDRPRLRPYAADSSSISDSAARRAAATRLIPGSRSPSASRPMCTAPS